MSSCQLFVPVFVNTGKSIGGRNRTLVTRVWNPVRNHCSPTWPECGQKKRAACCRMPGSDGSWEDLPLEITQVGRPCSGSARSELVIEGVVAARIAGTPGKYADEAMALATPSSGSLAVHGDLLGLLVLAGISLTQLPHNQVNAFPDQLFPLLFPAPPTHPPTHVPTRRPPADSALRPCANPPPRRAPEPPPDQASRRTLDTARRSRSFSYPIRNHPHPPATLLPRPPGHRRLSSVGRASHS